MQVDLMSRTKTLCAESQQLQKSIVSEHSEGKDIAQKITRLKNIQQELKLITKKNDIMLKERRKHKMLWPFKILKDLFV